ncbi:hypothetical protein LGH82_22845 [Mesorhizobium sp. PAMC28654]|uniref:hypothetical protein n=1 Tax=Mesorhizobium sp. PAMC28654 TaxID=2880934 RepID=UPI001D0A07B8|nr:hypothetical protein [Mesorhizobium sp. PAMC28654]UDL87979.1 hypothetical protein LGH82_22845 [Mesorhizobium sp. PAMC28654]
MFAYSNGGMSMRAVDPDYVAQTGEVLFADYATDAELAGVFPGYAPPTTATATVLKSTVMGRLTAGQMASAYTMLTANPVFFAKWFAPDKPFVNCTDPDAISFVKALGLDPATILAP